jgi:hypothetical protein
MTLIDQKPEFLKAIRAARGWVGLNKEEFTTLLFGEGSESTGDRLERGQIQKRTGTTELRRQLANTIIEKTGCPPGLFGLSGLESAEADRLRSEFDLKLLEAKNELRAEAATELDALEELLSSQGIAVPKTR